MKAIAVCACLLLPSMGLAQPIHAEAPVEYRFEDELVSGDYTSPNLEILKVRRRGERATLIEVRTNYMGELVKSVEDL